MQIVPPGQPLRQPNACFICEAWPNPDAGLPVVDTLRDFETQVITKLTGRKYVCHGCAEDIGKTVGLVDPSSIEAPEPIILPMTLGEMAAAIGDAVRSIAPDAPSVTPVEILDESPPPIDDNTSATEDDQTSKKRGFRAR